MTKVIKSNFALIITFFVCIIVFSLIMNYTITASFDYNIMSNNSDNNLEGLDTSNVTYFQQLTTILCYLLMLTKYDSNSKIFVYNNYLSKIKINISKYALGSPVANDPSYIGNDLKTFKNELYNNIKKVKINENNIDSINIQSLNNMPNLMNKIGSYGIINMLNKIMTDYQQIALPNGYPTSNDPYQVTFPSKSTDINTFFRIYPYPEPISKAYKILTDSHSPLVNYITTLFIPSNNSTIDTGPNFIKTANIDSVLQNYKKLYNNLLLKQNLESKI